MDGSEKKEIRRPMNAFLIFCKRHRGFVREKNPEMDNRSVTRVLGDLWANLGEEKKIYTSLAKQYKDAFMKANPNYKWHNADKSQTSANKLVNRPTNSRVIKNVAEIHTDGTIIPGKLADPEQMGGLNLLLMADKETCESRVSSAPVTKSVTLVGSAPRPTHAIPINPELTPSCNSALLQLAEMCTSELHSGRSQRQRFQQLSTPVLSNTPSIYLTNASFACQPMQPPKKRVRHWSLTETDALCESSLSDSSSRDNVSGSLSPQNPWSHKTRCTSLGSAIGPKDGFSSFVKGRRRKLSSSATESIPSPSCSYADGLEDADSSVFSPEVSKAEVLSSEESKCGNHEAQLLASDNHQHSDLSVPELSVVSLSSSFNVLQQPVYQKILQPPQGQASIGHKRLPALCPEVNTSHAVVYPETQVSPVTSSFLSCLSGVGISVPVYALSSPIDVRNQNINQKTQIKVPDSSKPKDETAKCKAGLSSSGWNNLIKLTSQNQSPPKANVTYLEDKQKETRNSQMFDRFIHASNIVTLPSPLTLDLRSLVGSSSLATGADLPVYKDLRIYSSLNCNDTTALDFSVTAPVTCGGSETQPSSHNTLKSLVISSGSETEVDISQQGSFTPSLTFKDANKHDTVSVQLPSLKNTRVNSSSASLPLASNQTQTFSEGKLKKKWAERMLIETQMKEHHTVLPFSHNKVTDIGQNFHTDVQSTTNTLQPPTAADSQLNRNSLGQNIVPASALTPDLRMCSGLDAAKNHSSHQALLILSQSVGSLDPTSGLAGNFMTQNPASIMFQLFQNQFAAKTEENCPRVYTDKNRLEQMVSGPTITSQQDSVKTCKIQMSLVDDTGKNVATKYHGKKEELNQITACGQRFMDHIVEKLCQTNFSEDKLLAAAEVCDSKVLGRDQYQVPLRQVKLEREDESIPIMQVIKDEKKENSSENGSPPGSAASWRSRLNSQLSQASRPVDSLNTCRNEELASLATITDQDNKTRVMKLDSVVASCGQAMGDNPEQLELHEQASSPTNETHLQENPWSTALFESCDPSEINDDPTFQPVRKSRRANRGQKYQELIKEGFIQPSRERLAARNAERHGRSFGCKEEFDKIESRRTLKRSASERDTPLASLVYNAANARILDETKKMSGNFDLEKEIESLPMCSLDQLDKKKAVRRGCDSSETLGSPPSATRSLEDALPSLSQPDCLSGLQSLSPVGSSGANVETIGSDRGCPTTHILLPMDGRPSEPVTGSRKRKARRHCITRISVLGESTAAAEVDIQTTKCLPNPSQQTKPCTLVAGASQPVPAEQKTSQPELDHITCVGPPQVSQLEEQDTAIAAGQEVSDGQPPSPACQPASVIQACSTMLPHVWPSKTELAPVAVDSLQDLLTRTAANGQVAATDSCGKTDLSSQPHVLMVSTQIQPAVLTVKDQTSVTDPEHANCALQGLCSPHSQEVFLGPCSVSEGYLQDSSALSGKSDISAREKKIGELTPLLLFSGRERTPTVSSAFQGHNKGDEAPLTARSIKTPLVSALLGHSLLNTGTLSGSPGILSGKTLSHSGGVSSGTLRDRPCTDSATPVNSDEGDQTYHHPVSKHVCETPVSNGVVETDASLSPLLTNLTLPPSVSHVVHTIRPLQTCAISQFSSKHIPDHDTSVTAEQRSPPQDQCPSGVSLVASTTQGSVCDVSPASDKMVSEPASLGHQLLLLSSVAASCAGSPDCSPSPSLYVSTTSLSSPVMSLASSNKSDIITYTVIGSTSVMETGSSHMIGSPHLPESPSIAIVQS